MQELFGTTLCQKLAAANYLLQFDGRLRLSNAESFPGLLITLHQIIRASVPLMVRAQQVLTEHGKLESERISTYLASHIEEEQNHDRWLLDDLKILGWTEDAVLALHPANDVIHLVGSQYYLINHHDPALLLGYIAALEGVPPVADDVRDRAIELGIPLKALRTVLYHAEHDITHSSELYDFISSLSLTNDQKTQITSNALRTIATLSALPVSSTLVS